MDHFYNGYIVCTFVQTWLSSRYTILISLGKIKTMNTKRKRINKRWKRRKWYEQAVISNITSVSKIHHFNYRLLIIMSNTCKHVNGLVYSCYETASHFRTVSLAFILLSCFIFILFFETWLRFNPITNDHAISFFKCSRNLGKKTKLTRHMPNNPSTKN